jgi:hypothetical protein
VPEQIHETVVVHVFYMATHGVPRGGSVGSECQRGYVHVCHVEDIRPEDGYGNNSPSEGVDGIDIAPWLDADLGLGRDPGFEEAEDSCRRNGSLYNYPTTPASGVVASITVSAARSVPGASGSDSQAIKCAGWSKRDRGGRCGGRRKARSGQTPWRRSTSLRVASYEVAPPQSFGDGAVLARTLNRSHVSVKQKTLVSH